ncbi:STAS domain-containing protein [Chitinibacter sp. SCUT-21]|uniref:STAS domain-containing protein n=1 Tax=Chitinibacter sp. SCUT-21 TaxID=2970891 RepID=UPI0035A643EB
MTIAFQAPAQLTSTQCGQLLGAIDAVLQQDNVAIDLSQVNSLDSSAVALLLEWQRRALRANRQLEWQAPPAALRQLVKVYGVQDLLQIKP